VRITHVVARAFGPFRDARLDLAPGLTVVAGPNESGKSSWHAAIRLAITGLRRGRGRATAVDAALSAQHRPWEATDDWEVEAGLLLDDGRAIEVRQDLAGKVGCSALDVGLGRDVSNEILDGTPDASRWLGLDRDTFAATISVSQAQILAVAQAAGELQEQMQRAAATRGTDGTAAEAIERLTAHRRDAVGADTANAKGPLRLAKLKLASAVEAREAARSRHAEHLIQQASVEDSTRTVEEARLHLDLALAAQARYLASETERRAARAATLAARHHERPVLASRDGGADLVAAAVTGWERRPAVQALDGPSSESLDAAVRALPEPPTGDLAPHADVVAAVRDLDMAEEAVRVLGEPPITDPQVQPGDEPHLRELARRIRGAAGADGALEPRAPESTPRRGRAIRVLVPPLVCFGVAVLLAWLGQPLSAVAFTGLGLVAATWGVARQLGTRAMEGDPVLESMRRSAEAAWHAAEIARRAAIESGLPTDPGALEELADRALLAARDRRDAAVWEERRHELTERLAIARNKLSATLAERGVDSVNGDARSAWLAYQSGCEERAGRTAASARREALVAQLAARRLAEDSLAASTHAVEEAERALREAAEAVGMPQEGAAPNEVREALRQWQERQAIELQASRVAIEEWRELETLLRDATLSELADEASRRKAIAERLEAALPAAAPTLPAGHDLESVIDQRRRALAGAEAQAAEHRGALESSARALPDVAEAEEAVATAAEALARVESTARTIDETLRLLRSAQERVHRDLAPILADAVRRWLPRVSAGAYADVSVDPADLSIQVKETLSGIWREARLLSEGTREQIYLLLRVAMAQHLVTTPETAPLLLDEVTAQADAERRAALLEVLHALSAERQIVLFTHDAEVAAWAERTLAGPRDRLIRLPSITRPRAHRAGDPAGSIAIDGAPAAEPAALAG
jgi:exonuclease SbcC